MRDHAFHDLGSPRPTRLIRHGNGRSRRVAERIGTHRAEVTVRGGCPSWALMHRPRPLDPTPRAVAGPVRSPATRPLTDRRPPAQSRGAARP